MHDSSIKVFTGNANPVLAQKIVDYMKIPLGDAKVVRFADGEIAVNINESVRGCSTYIVQPLCPPANESLMELLIMIDALKRASAPDIIAVVPYYAYARQDRKAAPREPITAKLVADLLEAAGCTRLVTMDLHAGQIQGFFNIPVDHLFALPIFIEDLRARIATKAVNDDIIIVSPDAGGVERARAFAKRLHCGLAIIDKRRPKPNVAEVMNIIGDVEGKQAIIIDDLIDTAGTLTKSAEALVKRGATKVSAYATHAVFSGSAIERIETSVLDEVVVSDSIPLKEAAQKSAKIRAISCASLVGEAMNRVHSGTSISSLFL